MKFKWKRTCPECNGIGYTTHISEVGMHQHECDCCKGTKYVEEIIEQIED